MKYLDISYLKIMVLALSFCLSGNYVQAQTYGALYASPAEIKPVQISEGMALHKALAKLEQEFGVVFLYRTDAVQNKNVANTYIMPNNVERALTVLLKGQELGFKYLNPKTYGIYTIEERTAEPKASAFQQVRGVVTDASSGESLPGVNVLIKGTTQGTATSADGSFNLEVPSLQDTLVFSFVGYQTQEVPINGRSEVNVEMQLQAVTGEELVVTGYGMQRRSEITGSVGMVSGDVLEEQSAFNALQSLRGKVPGVNIFSNSGSPTGSNRVIIRGVGTINASTDPLYVIDGVVMENMDLINPNDIESIEVLKDASAAAIYGARGANGVILITTQRGGSASDGLTVSYDADFSIGKIRRKMDVLNAEEFMKVLEIGYANAPKYNDYVPGEEPVLTRNDPRLFDAQGNPIYDTDWQDEATRTAYSHNHQLAIRSGGKTSSYGAFLNYTDREGIMLNSFMQRVNFKIVYDANPKEWLSLGTNLSVNRTWENNFEEGGGHQMPRRTMIEMPPIFPVKFKDGTWSNSHSIQDDYGTEAMANPVHVLETQDRLRDRTQLFGNTFLAFQITPNLEFRTQIGIDNTLYEARNYSPRDLINISAPDGSASIVNYDRLYWQNENYLTYRQEIGAHRINSILGASWQQRTYRENSMSTNGFSDDFFRFNSIGTATNPNPPGSYADDWTMNSYFARGSYTYNETYSATITARVDGSSKFGANSKYGFFPSAGVAWLVTNESFMSDIDAIDNLRLRASYGITGNSEIGLYQSLATMSSGTTLIGGSRQPSSYVQRLANPELEWEKTTQYNAGFELGIFNYLVTIEMDYYYKLTDDLLLARPVPTTTGFSSIMDNIGSLSNQGVDFMITTRNIQSSGFLWTSTLNFNYNQNRIESLGAEDEDIFPGPNWVSGSQTILRVGEPVASFYGYVREGIWGTDEAVEAAAAGSVPGEAKRSAERQIIGNGLPDWSGSFINRFNIGNFDIVVDLQFVYGVDNMQQFLHSTEDRTGIASGLSTILYEGWTENNQNTMVQQIRNAQLSGQNSELDDHWVVDGSYIRGNLFSVGYTFQPATLSSLGLKRLRVNAALENAFVIHSSDFKGYDPEATSWSGDQWGQNISFFQYPKPRTFTLGVSVQF